MFMQGLLSHLDLFGSGTGRPTRLPHQEAQWKLAPCYSRKFALILAKRLIPVHFSFHLLPLWFLNKYLHIPLVHFDIRSFPQVAPQLLDRHVFKELCLRQCCLSCI